MDKKRIMSTYASPSEAHRMSEELRENDKHLDALKSIEEAIIGYQQEQNYQGFAKAIQSRVLIYKHLFLLTKDKAYAVLAKHDAEASLEITQEHGLQDSLSSCYFRLGEVNNLFGDYKQATVHFQKAIDTYIGTNTEKGDYRYHLGEAMYRSGEKDKGKEAMLEGLKEIQDNSDEVDPFLIHVWESGCYMKLAEVLKVDEPEKAKEYLANARKIIDSDDKLVIRRRQFEALAGSIK